MNEYDEKVKKYKRCLVKKLLDQCTEKQKEFFNRIYKSIDDIKEEQMHIAYDQCQKTLIKNKKGK